MSETSPQVEKTQFEIIREDALAIAESAAQVATKKALAVRLQNEAKLQATDYMNPTIWKQMSSMADTFVKSNAIPSYLKNTAQVMVVLQTGHEMGLKPMEAINDLYIVKGSVNLWGKGLVKAFRRHGYEIEFPQETDTAVEVNVKQDGRIVAMETYRYEDAVESGYTTNNDGSEKFGWKKGLNRRLKLRYGALALVAKTRLPEVLGSIDGVAELTIDSSHDEKQVGADNQEESVEVKPSSIKNFINRSKNVVEKQPVQEAEVVKMPEEEKKEIVEAKEEATPPKPKKKVVKTVEDAVKAAKELGKKAKPDTKDPNWQKAKRAYFATLKEQKLEHSDVKEIQGFNSLNDLTTDEIKELTKKLK